MCGGRGDKREKREKRDEVREVVDTQGFDVSRFFPRFSSRVCGPAFPFPCLIPLPSLSCRLSYLTGGIVR
jgi:hypothetical protein